MGALFYERRSENTFIGPLCDVPFPLHVHDVVEIVCVTQGEVAMTVGGDALDVAPGDIAVVFPNVSHSFEYVSPDADGLAMIFVPDAISEFTHAFRCQTAADPLLKGDVKAPMLDRVIAMIKEELPKDDALRLGYLHLFLSYLFTCIRLKPVDKPMFSGASLQVLQYISEHFTEPLSLESTARALGISRIHLSHIFSQQLRINFRQYINTLRITHACTLLRKPEYSVSQVSYLCGYGNPRTFHRAFQLQCRMTPGEYRDKMTSVRAD